MKLSKNLPLLSAVTIMALAALAWHFGMVPPGLGTEHVLIGLGGIIGGQMTPGQARVVDPILTTVAQGYKNGLMVADFLFPVVPVDQRGGKIIQFGKEDFQLFSTIRAPGANTKRVQYGYSGDPYSLDQHALEAVVPFEIQGEASTVPGIDVASVSIGKTQSVIALSREYAAAQLATNVANYDNNHKVTLSGSDKWSDYSGTSDPSQDIDDAIEAVRASTGRRPNTVELSPVAFKAARRHPKILENFKYTGRDSVTAEMLAAHWNVERVVVGDAVYDSGNGFADVWGRDVVVAFTQIGSLADQGLPSYGYTYRLRGFPTVETPYPDRSAKSMIYPVTDELQPVLASAISGFLIKNAA
jgi:hypothetical protein